MVSGLTRRVYITVDSQPSAQECVAENIKPDLPPEVPQVPEATTEQVSSAQELPEETAVDGKITLSESPQLESLEERIAKRVGIHIAAVLTAESTFMPHL